MRPLSFAVPDDFVNGFKQFSRQRLPSLVERYRKMRAVWDEYRARQNRRCCETYVGVTGSCGKSTATYLTGILLSAEAPTHAFVEFNARRSILRRLARFSTPVKFMVQEISGDRPGNIATLTPILKPDIAVITTVGHDHFASFKSIVEKGDGETPVDERYLKAIAREKGSLVAGLGPTGIACLNADDPHVRAMAARAPGRVVFYGRAADAEVRAENISAAWPQRLGFDLVIGGRRRRVETRFVGTLALTSVLGALAVVHAVAGDMDRAVAALATVEPVFRRMSVHAGTDGHTYILDTAKAPLWQVQLLLEDLPNLEAPSLVFVLGEISDSRNDKSAQYRKLLRRASGRATHVVGFGPAANSALRLREEGCDSVVGLETFDQAVAFLAALPPSLVLLKSGKAVQLTQVWDMVRPEAGDGAAPARAEAAA